MARRSGERAINGRMPMEPTTSSRSEVVSEQAIAMFLRLRWFCHLALTWECPTRRVAGLLLLRKKRLQRMVEHPARPVVA